MMEIGKYNTLNILKINNKGLFLDGGDNGEIFLPLKEAPNKYKENEPIEVFVYNDSKDRLTATSKQPYATVGQFAYLKVVSVNTNGAFMDWGLEKDLFVPFREQGQPMEEGRSYVVYIYFDEKSKRIAVSSKLIKFNNKQQIEYTVGEEVSLLIANETDLGYKAIINRTSWGVLYKNEVFKQLKKGQEIQGYIKKIRSDNKIDLTLHKIGPGKATDLSQVIMDKLKQEGGFLAVNDKSSPRVIYQLFGESKSTFKNALGGLYKKRLIVIEKHGIRLSTHDNK